LTPLVNCITGYPFSSSLEYQITAETNFDFAVRIPAWTADKASIQLNGRGYASAVLPDSSGLHHVSIEKGFTTINVVLPMEITTVVRNSSVGIYYGPLLYAADIAYNTTDHQPLNWTDRTPLPDAEVHPKARDHVLTPTSAWQFAIDPSTVTVETRKINDLPNPIFERGAPPTSLFVDAYPITWAVDHDTAALPPVNPVVNGTSKIKLKLIPYGAAKLHIAQFPVAKISSGNSSNAGT
jgi:hypothetical protein